MDTSLHHLQRPSMGADSHGSRAFFVLLCIWVYVSALYYAENLFFPTFAVGYEEGTYHKAIKYFVCSLISAYALVKTRNPLLTFVCLSLLGFAAVPVLIGGRLDISAVSILIAATMSGMIGIIPLYRHRLHALSMAVVLSGCLVGLFSMVEITVLSVLFESYWRSTGGLRSSSTMLNPNNLGLYIGACLILLPFLRVGLIRKCMFASVLLFPFVASGSRTAWVSIVLTLIVALFGSQAVRRDVVRLIQRNFFSLLFLTILIVSSGLIMWGLTSQVDVESSHRGADLYTASIRLKNFVQFFALLDEGILLPDIYATREHLVQDNFYLIFVNSFGLLMTLILIGFLLVGFAYWRRADTDLRPWRLMFLYFLISGLSGSFLNSFPNNQMFFMAAGSVLVVSRMRRMEPAPCASLAAKPGTGLEAV